MPTIVGEQAIEREQPGEVARAFSQFGFEAQIARGCQRHAPGGGEEQASHDRPAGIAETLAPPGQDDRDGGRCHRADHVDQRSGRVPISARLRARARRAGLEQDQQVEERRVVLGVIEIVFELVARILDRGAIGIVDLRPAGDARLHHVAFGVIGQLVFQIGDEFGTFGRGPTKLISPFSTLQVCGSSSMRTLRMNLPTRVTRGSSFCAHCAPSASASVRIERSLITSNASPYSPTRSGGRRPGPWLSSFTRSANSTITGAVSGQQQRAGGDVEQALGARWTPRARRKPVGKDQPAGIDRIEIDPARLAFDEAGEIVDVDAGGLDPQQILERQRIAPLLQRQHHFADAQVLDEAGEVVDRAARDRFLDNRLAIAHADVADDDEAAFRPFAQLAQALRADGRRRAPARGRRKD
jgi:hypothetical protein